jgi:hypothetical protein
MAMTEDELFEDVKYWKGRAEAAEYLLTQAEEAIRGVVTSYPVADGTSKYGYEEDHDGYGSIRECRLYLERFSSPDTRPNRTKGEEK